MVHSPHNIISNFVISKAIRNIITAKCWKNMQSIFSAFVFVQGVCLKSHNFWNTGYICLSNSALERAGAALYDQLSNSFYENCAMRLILSWRLCLSVHSIKDRLIYIIRSYCICNDVSSIRHEIIQIMIIYVGQIVSLFKEPHNTCRYIAITSQKRSTIPSHGKCVISAVTFVSPRRSNAHARRSRDSNYINVFVHSNLNHLLRPNCIRLKSIDLPNSRTNCTIDHRTQKSRFFSTVLAQQRPEIACLASMQFSVIL